MNPKLNKKFDRLEAQRRLLFKLIEDMDDAAANTSKAPGQWSIAQVFQHMVMIEQWSLSYLSKRLADKDYRGTTGLKEFIKSKLLNTFLWLPVKYKAPKSVSATIPEKIEFDALKTQWSSHRTQLNELLESLSDNLSNQRLYKHPIIGYINIFQFLDFLYFHTLHHLPQIKGLLSNKSA